MHVAVAVDAPRRDREVDRRTGTGGKAARRRGMAGDARRRGMAAREERLVRRRSMGVRRHRVPARGVTRLACRAHLAQMDVVVTRGAGLVEPGESHGRTTAGGEGSGLGFVAAPACDRHM